MLGNTDIDQDSHCFKLNALWMGEPPLIQADSDPWVWWTGTFTQPSGWHSAILLFISECYCQALM